MKKSRAYKDLVKKGLNDLKKTRKKYGTVKYKARDVLRHAVHDGRIKKPSICSRCKNTGKIEGHHEDYSKPFDVIWLCSPCHKELHKDLFLATGRPKRSEG